ncbi:MAG: nuclear transport factor 2 family protein [Pseudomonadota bacterium]
MATDLEIVQRGWAAVARGDWDALIADYTEDMIFVMPGQTDILTGTAAFRGALENLGAALPPGFDIGGIRYIGAAGEIVCILDFTAEKLPEGSQLAVLFRLRDSKVFEERWFVDTEQWRAAF